MTNRVLQLKRYRDIYPDKDNALRSLNAYVATNIDVLRDGEPIIGHYFEEGKCKVLVGIIHKLREDSVNGVNWINADDNSQSLTPADSSISITDGQIKVNLENGIDNILKVGENGAFVSLQEILEAVPETDLSDIEAKIDKIHNLGFGGAVSGDTTAEDLYAEDDRLSAATSMVDADKMLSKAIDDNSMVIAAAANNLNERINEAVDKFQIVFGKSAADTVSAEELYEEDANLSGASSMAEADRMLSRVVDENAFVTSAALNNLNTRSNIISGDVESVISRLDAVGTNLETLNDKIENLDAIDVDNTLTKTSAITEDGKVVYTIGVIIDNSLDENSSLPVANSAVSTVIKENEEVVAAALNDLNNRLIELSGNSHDERVDDIIRDLDALEDTVGNLSSGLTDVRDVAEDSANDIRNIESGMTDIQNDISELADYTADAINGIDSGLTNVESGLTEVTLDVENLEMDVDTLKDEVSGLTSGLTELSQIVSDNELVVAAAFNDVNDRLIELEENTVTEITSDTFKIERTGGSVNIDFEDGIIDFGEY